MQPRQLRICVTVDLRWQAVTLVDDTQGHIDLVWEIREPRGKWRSAVGADPPVHALCMAARTAKVGNCVYMVRAESRKGRDRRTCPAATIRAMAIGNHVRRLREAQSHGTAIAPRREQRDARGVRRQPAEPRSPLGYNAAKGFRCPFSTSAWTRDSLRKLLAYAGKLHRDQSHGT